jgi:hypothetical protein
MKPKQLFCYLTKEMAIKAEEDIILYAKHRLKRYHRTDKEYPNLHQGIQMAKKRIKALEELWNI